MRLFGECLVQLKRTRVEHVLVASNMPVITVSSFFSAVVPDFFVLSPNTRHPAPNVAQASNCKPGCGWSHRAPGVPRLPRSSEVIQSLWAGFGISQITKTLSKSAKLGNIYANFRSSWSIPMLQAPNEADGTQLRSSPECLATSARVKKGSSCGEIDDEWCKITSCHMLPPWTMSNEDWDGHIDNDGWWPRSWLGCSWQEYSSVIMMLHFANLWSNRNQIMITHGGALNINGRNCLNLTSTGTSNMKHSNLWTLPKGNHHSVKNCLFKIGTHRHSQRTRHDGLFEECC